MAAWQADRSQTEDRCSALPKAKHRGIAARLKLSDGTVRNYLSEAIGKVGAANRVEAARIARERGWL